MVVDRERSSPTTNDVPLDLAICDVKPGSTSHVSESTVLPGSPMERISTHQSLPTSRKVIILITASWMSLAATFASTALFPANAEVAEEFHTTTESINYANAGLILAMAFASFIWNPLSRVK